MKKVLFVASVTSHINSFHIPYLKWFKEQGYEVHVASNGNEKIEYCDKHFDIPFERFPIKVNNLRAYKQLKNVIDENKYTIIHCHTPVGGVLTRLAAINSRKKNNTKVMYTAHGFHFYKGAPILNWIIYYPIEKICAKWTDCLITITNEDYEFAKKHLKVPKISHINGIGMNVARLEKKLSQEEKNGIRRNLEINQNDMVFSYIAELNENKNQMLLIHVMEELKKEKANIKLLLIGDGPLKDKYNDYIKSNEIDDVVKILGRRQDINDLLSITDIYLASSKREGLPVNIKEAMYKGLPIIATNNRGHRELVNNGINGYIDKDIKTKSFKKLLLLLIENQEIRQKVKKYDEEVIKKYEINSVINEMKEIYNDMEEINNAGQTY